MTTTLSYGRETICLLDSEEVVQLRPQSQQPLSNDEIAAAVRAQLDEPHNYPPLSRATIPGDCIVLAIEPGIPQQLSVIDGALTALRNAGAEEALITILLSGALADAQLLKNELAALGHAECHIKVHDPDDAKGNSFLGVNQAGQALRINRRLCDADFVLPIAVATLEVQRRGQPASLEGLLTAFSAREAIERFSADAVDLDAKACADHLNEIDECGRLLGIGMTLQVVPSPGGNVSAVLAGEPTNVASQAAANYRQTWCCDTESRGGLVVATIAGDADQQTWQNVGRAVAAAEAVLETGGAIAIYSELAEPPGRSLCQLVGNEDPRVVEREILRHPSADSGPALQLCRALQRGAIYLHSQLRPAVVESLGMTPLDSDSELQHLAKTLRPCLVLAEAQRLLPTVVEAEAGSA